MNPNEYEEAVKRKDAQLEELKERNEVLLNTTLEQEKEISRLNKILQKMNKAFKN